MPSPFPGMDPFLEIPWLGPDFHHELAASIRGILNPRLPPGYYVLVPHRVVVDHMSPEEVRVLVPDASVLRDREVAAPMTASGQSGGVLTAPVEVDLEIPVPAEQFFVEVRRRPSEELVTVIEIVSPANKRPGKDHEAYLAKRDEYFLGDAHFIEIDLLRGGRRWKAGDEPALGYRVLLSRSRRRHKAGIWPFGVRDPLPPTPVPLARGDADVELPLRSVLSDAYERAGYARWLDYSGPVPPPPLSDEDAAWVRQVVDRR
ncbi:MAG: DUF4058 family protein [Planctomycetes bacterium]|nr:DUF4058 family protein [Planctomycetota bacterium]